MKNELLKGYHFNLKDKSCSSRNVSTSTLKVEINTNSILLGYAIIAYFPWEFNSKEFLVRIKSNWKKKKNSWNLSGPSHVRAASIFKIAVIYHYYSKHSFKDYSNPFKLANCGGKKIGDRKFGNHELGCYFTSKKSIWGGCSY